MKDLIVDFDSFDPNRILHDRQEIEQYNAHRFEMSLLDGILYENLDEIKAVAFHDPQPDAFWVRGHFPGFAVMPGVLVCEAAAQLCCYIGAKANLFSNIIAGLGAIEEVRFRAPVRPGDRLIVMLGMTRFRKNVMITGHFQCFVDRQLTAEGIVKGVAMGPASQATSST